MEENNNPQTYKLMSSFISNEPTNVEELEVIAKRIRSGKKAYWYILPIVIGAILFLFLVGVILVVFCSMNMSRALKNNKVTYDCVYYDKKHKKIIMFDMDSRKFVFDIDDICYLKHDGNTGFLYAGIDIGGGKARNLYTGISSEEECHKCAARLREIKK